jgi:8-oxo-dGTP pyrophosphatase MutT (NUDIX family)
MIFESEPQSFSPRFEIVSCFFECDGKILLLHRRDHKSEGNTWGVPAGKMELGESAEQAMFRELKQETGYQAKPGELSHFKKVYVQYSTYDFVYHIYHLMLPEKVDININPGEHKNYQWVTPTQALQGVLIPDLDACIRLFYNL